MGHPSVTRTMRDSDTLKVTRTCAACQLSRAGKEKGHPGGPRASLMASLVRRDRRERLPRALPPVAANQMLLLLHFELSINYVILAALAVSAGRAGRTGGRTARLALARVQVLGHGLRGLFQVADGPAGGRDVLAAGRLLEPFDRRLDRGLVRVLDLVARVPERLLDLVDQRLGLVALVNQLLLAVVLVGVGLGVPLHPLDLVLR